MHGHEHAGAGPLIPHEKFGKRSTMGLTNGGPSLGWKALAIPKSTADTQHTAHSTTAHIAQDHPRPHNPQQGDS
ncbi:predicted protein [Histoplasma mississippiense (nom. inval.)]|uniref:predicted protein n=1 Tax=Ajellomyces capsulatus (strain NAm1 / WU24) TaxID=2059318 RepID=UPI000157BC36|nr:predicted protein [Histoplasma mississippiense (nom. inval.)]EDN05537.1 predicted protein [Histoplasma mississippiense (nom. inval.)]